MQTLQGLLALAVSSALITVGFVAQAPAQSNPGGTANNPQAPAKERDAQHDWDWDIGTWTTHQRRLLHPLTGSTTWVDYHGTDVVRKIWDGRATLGEIEADGPAGHLELLALRLYDPQAHRWGIYFTSSAAGTLSKPVVGVFSGGRGDFYDQETLNGKDILVRFSVYDITPNSCHFEQAFSADWGKTWEVNFVVTETRSKGGAAARQ